MVFNTRWTFINRPESALFEVCQSVISALRCVWKFCTKMLLYCQPKAAVNREIESNNVGFVSNQHTRIIFQNSNSSKLVLWFINSDLMCHQSIFDAGNYTNDSEFLRKQLYALSEIICVTVGSKNYKTRYKFVFISIYHTKVIILGYEIQHERNPIMMRICCQQIQLAYYW